MHIVLGVSLGGHSAWQCLFHDARVTAAIIVIGCPDYYALISDRARLSKRSSWKDGSPPGANFLGSKDFPVGLKAAVEAYDPAGMLLGDWSSRTDDTYDNEPSKDEQASLLPLMRRALQGKRVLNLAGGADKLVPYKCAEPFLRWLETAIAPRHWFGDGSVYLKDLVFEGIGHQMSPEMVKEAIRFTAETIKESLLASTNRSCKM